ncbi:MAG: DUF423 domain-containing protein [Rhodospirillales bacterium]
MRLWLFLGALNGMIAVAAGAYGWHWLDVNEGFKDIFNMGVDYQMWHALALIGVAWLQSRQEATAGQGGADGPGITTISVAGWMFTIGIVLFSGTLYIFGHTGTTLVPGAAPIGGLCLIIGWAALMWAAVKEGRPASNQ